MKRQTQSRRPERGYILVTLTLFVALLTIAAVALAPTFAFQMKRDREEEMVHRGVQYSRAIQKYFKKFGRYPTSLADLENTNNLRFLRQRYKDPITGKDFKLLHYTDIQMMGAGAGIAGMTPASGMPGGLNGLNSNGLNSNGGLGAGLPATGGQPTAGPGSTGAPGGAEAEATSDANSSTSQSSLSSSPGSPQIGGGPIVGVTSFSKAQSIREFGGKNHYNQWQFTYDPALQRTGLITTPAQPLAYGAASPMNGQPGTSIPGISNSGIGPNQPGSNPNPSPVGSQPAATPTPDQNSGP
jgi:type II secretory pathway pseudopilin PulG